jgi:hypothetical protein
LAPGGGEDRLVLGHLARGGVDEVAEDREVDARIEVSESQHLDVLDKPGHGGHARQQRGHDHHGSRVVGDSRREFEAGEASRRYPTSGQALHEGDRHLAGRKQQEQRRCGPNPER